MFRRLATDVQNGPWTASCGQSYKQFTIVNYDSRVVPDMEIPPSHPEKLAGDHKKILIDGDLDFLKEAPFWNQEMKKIKFPMDVQKSYELSKLIP